MSAERRTHTHAHTHTERKLKLLSIKSQPPSPSEDMAKWMKLIAFVRRGNALFTRTSLDSPTLYAVSYINPFNYISLRLLSRLFRISPEFWDDVVVPLYSSSVSSCGVMCV